MVRRRLARTIGCGKWPRSFDLPLLASLLLLPVALSCKHTDSDDDARLLVTLTADDDGAAGHYDDRAGGCETHGGSLRTCQIVIYYHPRNKQFGLSSPPGPFATDRIESTAVGIWKRIRGSRSLYQPETCTATRCQAMAQAYIRDGYSRFRRTGRRIDYTRENGALLAVQWHYLDAFFGSGIGNNSDGLICHENYLQPRTDLQTQLEDLAEAKCGKAGFQLDGAAFAPPR